MSNKYIYIIFAAVILGANSCVSPDDMGEGPVVEQNAISLSTDLINLTSAEGEQIEIEVQTKGEWHVEGLTAGVRTWLSLSAESGADSTVVKIACIEENIYMHERIAVLSFRNDSAEAVLIIRQDSDPDRSVSLSTESVEIGGKAGEEASVVLQTSKSWVLDGYTDEIQSWLEISPSSGESGGEITLRAISSNEGPDIREALVGFRIDKVNCVWLTIVQGVFVETKTIQWANNELIAPEGASYQAFPYYTGQKFTLDGVFYDGLNGPQTAVGSITEAREYIVKDKESAAPYYIEFGPSKEASETVITFYCNHNNPQIRVRNAYIKTPALEGFKLSKVKLTSINSASQTCIYISKNIKTQQEYTVDGQYMVKFGKSDPVNVELKETVANTSYYIVSDQDRAIDSFEFYYIKVR